MVVSIVAGAIFGLAVAGVNTAIVYRAVKKNSNSALTGAVVCRMLLDLLALGTVYLTRNYVPLLFEPTLIATAVGLSAGVIALAILVSRRSDGNAAEKKGE